VEASLLIDKMPDVLRWSSAVEVLERVHNSFVEEMSRSLGYMLARVRHEDPIVEQQLVRELVATTPEGLTRVLIAPETTFRLQTMATDGRFLHESLLAEAARAGDEVAVQDEIWSALGDTVVRPPAEVAAGPAIEGFMPLDFESPHATNIDLLGGHERLAAARRPLAGRERELVLERLMRVQLGIYETSPAVGDFVVRFTKVLILQKDDTVRFSSGSSGQYIGRSFIANPQWPTVDEVDLADAVVHEAVHGLLYMQELQRPWVLDDRLYEYTPRAVSPWSGRELPVRQFLQACFVWYALAHFWRLALSASIFPTERVQSRIAIATAGFFAGPLLERLGSFVPDIAEDVKNAVIEMEEVIRQSFPAVIC
jgi:hypothetical protein